MHKLELIGWIAAALAVASPAAAQERGHGNGGIPPGQRPQAGMCRVWIDGVPPGHQPAPTDCVTAERTRPANARVIYGDQTMRTGRREVMSNGSVVTIDGRQCARRIDRNGNITYRCPTGVYDSRGVFVPPLRVDDRSRVLNRDDDDDDRGKKAKNKFKKDKDRGHDDDRN